MRDSRDLCLHSDQKVNLIVEPCLNMQVVPVLSGKLAVIRVSDQCTEIINTGNMVLAALVTSDLVPWKPGLELVFAADDGTIACLGAKETSEEGYC